MSNCCHHCNKRTMTCHDDCPDYKKLVEENEKKKQAIRKQKQESADYILSRPFASKRRML